jgi:putative selenium metabolism protein SsnA
MVDLLIKNGLVVTMDKNCKIVPYGSVEVDDGRIISVKKGARGAKADEIIDATGKIVMPGLICSHTHLYGIFLRGAPMKINPPTDFTQILQRVWWPMDEAMTKEDAYASALISCLEFLKTGTTLFADTFSGPNAITGVLDKISLAVEQSGIRGILAFETTERRSRAEGAKGMKENERFIKKLKKRRARRVGGMVSVHASFTVSDELLLYAKDVASRHKVPLTIHVSESLVDVYHSYQTYGKRTVERLKEDEVLGPDVVLAHCVYVNDDELEIIQKTAAKVAHNPMSNMLKAVGVAPVERMLKMGIKTGLGNDGYIFDGFENIRAAYLLQKVATGDPRVISPREVLEMATIRGAELYGFENELGSIESGKHADLIIINPSTAPTPVRPDSVLEHLVNTVSGNDVETVVVGGRTLMRDRNVLSMNEDHVVNISRNSVRKLWKRLRAVKR